MTFLPVTTHDAIALAALRDDLAPLIGERAVGLFEFAISDGFGGELAGQRRETLIASGENPDAPQVTEAEQLLIDWGRAIGHDPRSVPVALDERITAAFSPASRTLLVAFASRVVAANVFAAVGRVS